MLPIFGKGKVNSNSHAGGAGGGRGEASKQNKSKPWSLNGIKPWAFVYLFVLWDRRRERKNKRAPAYKRVKGRICEFFFYFLKYCMCVLILNTMSLCLWRPVYKGDSQTKWAQEASFINISNWLRKLSCNILFRNAKKILSAFWCNEQAQYGWCLE